MRMMNGSGQSMSTRVRQSATGWALVIAQRFVLLCVWVLMPIGPSFGAPQPPSQPTTAAPTPQSAAPASSANATSAHAASTPVAIPSSRSARNVAIIPIVGAIDRYTVHSVEVRLERAQRAGANAVVFEINSPGGELGATLAVCRLIKSSPIPNTVAWVHSDAYSAGAIIALACREIIVDPSATMGDALPIIGDPFFGIQGLPDAEREKMLGPLLAEVVSSARINGYDEMLVQGLVRRGVELWLVEHKETGQRLFVNEAQYRLAVGGVGEAGQNIEINRSIVPTVPSATGRNAGPLAPISPSSPDAQPGPGQTAPTATDPTKLIPAAPGTSEELVEEVNDALQLSGAVSTRPDLTSAAHAGRYKVVEYVSDGHGLVVLKAPELLRYGVARASAMNDEEVKPYFGAASVTRIEPAWSEGMVRFLTHPLFRGLLIVVLLVSLFIEMTHPGATIPGIVAVVALLALVIPPALIDMASWWEILAIVVGLLLLAVEIFVLPGFGVCGVLGLVLLFGGIIGTFVGQGSGLFPNTPQQTRDLTWGLSTVFVALLASGVALSFLWRSLPNLPILKNLIHNEKVLGDGTSSETATDELLAAMDPRGGGDVHVGDTGITLSPLRPSGRAQFGDRVVDAHADSGMLLSGTSVKVVRIEGLRIVVDRA